MKAFNRDKMQPDAVLADIVGSEPRSRAEILRDFWQYIKEHGLQDTDRRLVNADRKLKLVLGDERKVNIFHVANLVEKHLN